MSCLTANVTKAWETHLRLLASGEGGTVCAMITLTNTDNIMPILFTTMPQVLTRTPFAQEAGLSRCSVSTGSSDGVGRAVAMNMGMYEA